ncbi:MAG: hypothetical protein WCO51_08150 [bacterium]
MASVKTQPTESTLNDRRFVLLAAFGFALLTLMPYLIGAILTYGRHYLWLNFNAQDNCVYLAWIRQAWEGHWTFTNRFTTDSQHSITINLFFWLLGRLSRLTGLSGLFWLHTARTVAAFAFVPVVYALLRQLDIETRKARWALLFVLLSSGFGWLWWCAWWRPIRLSTPVDMWQPEAITYLSFYLNPIFAVSLLLMVSSFYALLRAEKEGSWRWAFGAGLLMLIIGNIHSYDYLHLAAAWGLYLVVRRANRKVLVQSASAFLIAMPSVAYQYYLYKTEAVFRLRADVPTLSPHLFYYMMGYGLLMIGTILLLAWRQRTKTHPFLICWAIAGLAIAYVPVAFQRKMLMGEHIPLAALFGILLIGLLESKAPKKVAAIAFAILMLTTFSNIRWVYRDLVRVQVQSMDVLKEDRTSITSGETEMLAWIDANLPKNAAILAPPSFSLYIPPFAGRRVYCGHWGETPFYPTKRLIVYGMLAGGIAEELLANTKTDYIATYKGKPAWKGIQLDDLSKNTPPWLHLVHSNKKMLLYKVR